MSRIPFVLVAISCGGMSLLTACGDEAQTAQKPSEDAETSATEGGEGPADLATICAKVVENSKSWSKESDRLSKEEEATYLVRCAEGQGDGWVDIMICLSKSSLDEAVDCEMSLPDSKKGLTAQVASCEEMEGAPPNCEELVAAAIEEHIRTFRETHLVAGFRCHMQPTPAEMGECSTLATVAMSPTPLPAEAVADIRASMVDYYSQAFPHLVPSESAAPPPTPARELKRYQAKGGSTQDFEFSVEDLMGGWGGMVDMGGDVAVLDLAANSTLPSQGQYRFDPELAADYNPSTAGVEGREGDGIGSWIEFSWVGPGNYAERQRKVEPDPQPLGEFDGTWEHFLKLAKPCTGLGIVNGLMHSESIWRGNGRVKTFKLHVDGEHWGWIDLQDGWGRQSVDLDIPEGARVRLEIEEVFKGTKWPDTAISEISNYCRKGWPHGG
jgi:hypothetical protein